MEGLEGLRVNRAHARDANLQTLQTLHYWSPGAEARRELARAQRHYQTALAQRYARDLRITRAALRPRRAANRLRNTSDS